MKAGKEPMRSFGDLIQFFQVQDETTKDEKARGSRSRPVRNRRARRRRSCPRGGAAAGSAGAPAKAPEASQAASGPPVEPQEGGVVAPIQRLKKRRR